MGCPVSRQFRCCTVNRTSSVEAWKRRRNVGGTHNVGADRGRFGVHDEGNNETCSPIRMEISTQSTGTHTVETQNFSENEDKDLQARGRTSVPITRREHCTYTHHADEEPRLLRGAADTSVTDDTDGKACSETSKTDG